MSEAVLQRTILKALKAHPSTLWAGRTPAGRIGGYNLFSAGQSDITAVINHNGSLSLLFLEVKVEGGQLRYEQRRFFEQYEGKPKTMCVIINDVKQLKGIIEKCKQL
jgi:hypothetical protein